MKTDAVFQCRGLGLKERFHLHFGISAPSPPVCNTCMVLTAAHGPPQFKALTLSDEQYARRENSAGRSSVLSMSVCENDVGVPSASVPDPMLNPKSGAGAARVKGVTTRKERTREV